MSSAVSIMDVAKAAGVSKTTVSRVINGKLDQFRIGLATQARVRSVARQMGYQPDPIARNVALGLGSPPRAPRPVISSSPTPAPAVGRRQLGIVLAANSPSSTLALLPGMEPVLAAADYRLVMVTVPADPAGASQRVNQLLQEGTAGLLCCPSIFQATTAMAAGRCPVIVLWAGADKAMLAALNSPPPAQSPILTPPPVATAPAITPAPIAAPPVAAIPPVVPEPPAAPEPSPVIAMPEHSRPLENNTFNSRRLGETPRPTEIQPISPGGAKPPAEPGFIEQDTRATAPSTTEQPDNSITTPPPVAPEPPPVAVTPDPAPLPTPEPEPVVEPTPVAEPEPPQPVMQESPPVVAMPEPEPVVADSSATEQPDNSTTEPVTIPAAVIPESPPVVVTPDSDPLPTPEPEPVIEPVAVAPEPPSVITIPEPAAAVPSSTEPDPLPTPEVEPVVEPTPVAAAEPPPVVAPEPPPVVAAEPPPPVAMTEPVVADASATEQPDNSTIPPPSATEVESVATGG